MTNGSRDRLDRIEALVESNARSIQALGDRIAKLVQVQADAQDERQELRQVALGIANLLSAVDEDQPTILRKLNSIEQKVDRLLEHE